MIHRTIISGIACASLLLILGCGSDPAPQSSGGSPAPQPAADSPAPEAPADPVPAPAAVPEADPQAAAPESTTPVETKPAYSASDFGAPSQTPEPQPAPAETKPAEASSTPDLSALAMGGNLPKNLEDLIKGKSRKRPDDITKWELSDVVPAMKENDQQRLQAAISYIVKNNAENPQISMPLLAMGLRQVLDPTFLEKLSDSQGGGTPGGPGTMQPGGMPGGPGMMQPGGMPGEGYGGMNAGMGGQTLTINQQMAENIVYALAMTNTSEAANTLREIIKNKNFKTVHPQAVTKAAIKGLVIMDADREENDKVLFTALTTPKKYRNPSINTAGGYHGNPGMGMGMGMGPGGGTQGTEQRMSAEQLSQEAEQTLKPIASENLRVLLAEYLIKNTTPLTETDRFGPWFTESVPMNIPGQLTIYEKKVNETIPPSLETFLSNLEQNFTTYSGAAIARLLGVMATTPDLSLLGKAGQMGGMGAPTQSAGWGTGGGGGYGGGMGMGAPGYGAGGYGANADFLNKILSEKAKDIDPEEELVRLTKQIWNAKAADAVATRLNKQSGQAGTAAAYGGGPMGGGGGATGTNQDVTLACTMPLNKVRNAILKRCTSLYQNGPTTALGNTLGQSSTQSASMDPMAAMATGGAMGGMGMAGMGGGTNSDLLAVDPGLLVVLKTLPREDPNAQPNAPPRGGAPGAGAGPNGNIQHQWFNTSQQLVTRLFAQCLNATKINGGMSVATVSSETNNGEESEDPCPVAPHRGAEIVTRLDFKLPGYAKGPIGTLPADPLEVHYIRIEETTNLQKVVGHYKRSVKGQNHLLGNNMGYWFDAVTEGTTPGSKRSVDVVITPGVEKPADPFANDRNARRPKGVPIVVQILTIETADPTKAN